MSSGGVSLDQASHPLQDAPRIEVLRADVDRCGGCLREAEMKRGPRMAPSGLGLWPPTSGTGLASGMTPWSPWALGAGGDSVRLICMILGLEGGL